MKKKYKFEANRINSYNQMLVTLDKSTIKTHKKDDKKDAVKNDDKNEILKNVDKKNVTFDSKNDADYIDIKSYIDTIISQVNYNYKKDYSSSFFSGYDKKSNANIKYDPNEYVVDLNIFENVTKKYQPTPSIETPPIEIKEIIHINTEITNIADILALIEKYKLDPSIKYNINMKALHDIKEPLIELNNMIGIKELKNNIVDQILYFVQELHKNKNSTGDYIHTVIYGPPGTGKTEIAKIMGKIYSKIGILPKGTFKKVTRSDLIAGYLGQTAIKTRDVIKEALGGVLFIDEAYALGSSDKKDSFSKECIDTLCEALSDNKDNLMVIIAGYEKELKDCFFSYNQGLESRFSWRFKTDDYNYEDLYKIFLKKVNDIGWEISEDSKISSEWFKTNKEYFKYYGRDIEIILSKIKIAHSRRVFCCPENEKKKINLKDLDKGFETYLKNEDIKHRKDDEYQKKQLYYSLYS